MKVLAIETATSLLSVAVLEKRSLRAELNLDLGLVHSEKLVPSVGRVMQEAGVESQQLDGICVSLGPGSFTGLRIGLSVAKGLSLAWRKPLVGVPTLDAMALMAFPCPYAICPVIDARKGEIYAAVYTGSRGDRPDRQGQTRALSPRTFFSELEGDVLLFGSGADTYRGLIENVLGDRAHFLSPNPRSARASFVGIIGQECLRAREANSLVELEPLYLRPSEAELKPQGSEFRGGAGRGPMGPPAEAPLRLERMRPEDLEQVLVIERACFEQPWTAGIFLQEIAGSDLSFPVIIKRGGEALIGYAAASVVLDELHITNLAVHPAQRRKGVGTRLLQELLAEGRRRKCTIATLEVRPSNSAALSLYHRDGFKEIALRRRYYGNEDGIVMLLEL